MIFVEDQAIKVNGVVLPGLVKSIEVTEAAKVDEQEVEGSAAKPKQATGYEDAKVNIELILDDTQAATKHQRLETLRAVFRKPGQTVPQPIPIVNQNTAAHGIDKVIFKSLRHKAESKKDQLAVTLEFWEYVPQTITATKNDSGAGGKGAGGTAQPELNSDYAKYLSGSRGKSPSIDNAGASEGLNTASISSPSPSKTRAGGRSSSSTSRGRSSPASTTSQSSTPRFARSRRLAASPPTA